MRITIKYQKKPGRSRKASRWVAIGAAAACAATAGGPATLLRAQDAGSAASSRSERTLPVFRLAIEAGPLGEVLAAFERATGWKVEISDEGMKVLPSKGVLGLHAAAQALRQILAGTGLNYRVTGAGRAILEFEGVRSSDRRERQSADAIAAVHRALTQHPSDHHGDSE